MKSTVASGLNLTSKVFIPQRTPAKQEEPEYSDFFERVEAFRLSQSPAEQAFKVNAEPDSKIKSLKDGEDKRGE